MKYKVYWPLRYLWERNHMVSPKIDVFGFLITLDTYNSRSQGPPQREPRPPTPNTHTRRPRTQHPRSVPDRGRGGVGLRLPFQPLIGLAAQRLSNFPALRCALLLSVLPLSSYIGGRELNP